MVEFIYNHMYILIKILYSLYADTKRAIVIVLIILFGEYAKEAEPKTSLLSIHSKKTPISPSVNIFKKYGAYPPRKRRICAIPH